MERFFAHILKRNKLVSFIDLGRPWNAISVILVSFLGASLVSEASISLINYLILSVVILFIYMGSSCLNDIFDKAIDVINMPYRPLIRGSLKVIEAGYFATFCYIVGILISALISLPFFISILVMSLLSIMYSVPPFSLKNKGFLGNLTLGFVSGFVTFYSGYVLIANNLSINPLILIIGILLGFLFTFFSVLKDFKDMKGDRIYRKNTLVVKYGVRIPAIINLIGTIFFSILIILIFYIFISKDLIFLVTSSILILILASLGYEQYSKSTLKIGERSWTMARVIFLLFLITLLIF